MQRGELWIYASRGRPAPRLVAVVSSDGINDSRRAWLLAAPVISEDPKDILAVPVPEHGWVSAANISRVYRPWLSERVGVLDDDTLDRLAGTLRAALEL